MEEILKNKLLERQYDYSLIYNHHLTIKQLNTNYRDINFIIAVKGRLEYFRATLKNIILATKNTKLIINIVVVEQDSESHNHEFCKEQGVDYIFIPLEISKSDGFHSTSLMYNIGYLFSETAKYNMFHCCDTLVAHHFFDTLHNEYLNKPFNFIQPYCEKRVVAFTQSTTEEFLTGKGDGFDPSKFGSEYFNSSPKSPGAPGGSILVPTELFDAVGGYDPELFYGYTVEDSFFWGKLEAISTGERAPSIHFKGATYAEDPKLYLYHLEHPSAISNNAVFNEMIEYHKLFFNSSYTNIQQDYIELKKKLFNNEKEKIKLINESDRKNN